MKPERSPLASGLALGLKIAAATLLLSHVTALSQPAAPPVVIWEIQVEFWEDDGVTNEVRQSVMYSDFGADVSGSESLDWNREHSNGLATGGVTATWAAEALTPRKSRLTFSLDNNYQYNHSGGVPYLIFGGQGRLRVTPWVRGPAQTRTTTTLSHIAEVNEGGVVVTGLVCGGATWIYRRVSQSGGSQWELRTCDEAMWQGTTLYTKSYMTPSISSSITFGLTGPARDPFIASEFANIAVSFDIEICPADINNSGTLTVQDIFDFLAAYFASEPAGDFNGTGGHTVQDIFDFLEAYFEGCP